MLGALVGLVVAQPPDLRIIVHEQAVMEPRKGRKPCIDVREAGCLGGTATLGAFLREEAKGASHSLRIIGYDESKLVQFHPSGFSLNNDNWQRLGAQCGVIADPGMQTQPGLIPDAMRWLEASTIPVVMSNYHYTGTNPSTLQFYPQLARSTLISTGPLRVGVIALLGPGVFVPLIDPVLIATEFARGLRRRGADVIVVLCMGYEAYWGGPDTWGKLSQADVDVVNPPSCDDCTDTEMRFVNNTYVLAPSDSGYAGKQGEAFSSIDLRWVNGRLTPYSKRSVNIMVDTPVSLRDAQYESDLQWLQEQITLASNNDPPIGESTAPMPSGRIYDSTGSVVDEVCRRDYCPLGRFACDSMMGVDPSFDIAVYNGGSLRVGWDKGLLTKTSIYSAMPYENDLCSFNTTGPDIWRMVSKFVSKVTPDGKYNDSAEDRGGFMQLAGARYTFDPSRPENEAVLSLEYYNKDTREWEPVVRTRHYTIVTSSFLCEGGDGNDWHIIPGTKRSYPIRTQTLIIDLVLSQKIVTPPPDGSWMRLGDTGPSYQLPLLTDADCSTRQRFDTIWRECFDCPVGFQQDPTDKTRCMREVSGESNTWIWVLVGCGAAIILIGVPVGYRFTSNWRKMRRLHSTNEMATRMAESIACLQLDDVMYIKDIPHPNQLQKAFIKIIDIITELRSFLPQVLTMGDKGDDEEGSRSDLDEATASRDPKLHVTSSDHSHSERSHQNAKLAAAAFVDKDLQQKRITVLSLGLSKLHALSLHAEAVPLFRDYVDVFNGVVSAANGVVDHMSGDRVLVTFGAARSCPSQKVQACKCAQKLVADLKGAINLKPRIGVESGLARVGTLGSAAMKKHSCLGHVVNLAFACCRAAAWCDVGVVGGERLFDDTEAEVQYKALDVWTGFKHIPAQVYVVYEMQHVKADQENDEWMYQMEKSAGSDPFKSFNQTLRLKARQAASVSGDVSESLFPQYDQDLMLQRAEQGNFTKALSIGVVL
eukprot:Hpha_TRINITY_DN16512_c3_g4::TRINITY_DN16512_c3_g4_i1::g.134798::m.134798